MLQIKCYKSIQDVPGLVWEQFSPMDAVGLEIKHLQAIEVSRINNIQPYYLIGYHNEIPVGIAYCFALQINFARMANSYPAHVFATIKTWKPDFMDVRMIEVGHIASLGSTIKTLSEYTAEFLSALVIKIDEIAREENADICLIRDIDNLLFTSFKILEEYRYCPVMGFPIALMPIHWDSLDEYLASLKSKKRNTILQKRAKMQAPEITVEIIEDYAPYAERLTELWTNVAKHNNGYEHEQLTPNYFRAMSHYLKGRSHVVAIKKDDLIVAYGLNLIGDNEYFGMAEGMDYSFRDQYDLYANNILESLNVACKLGKKTFNIGITAYDFKTSIGTDLEPTFYFVKAFKNSDFSAVYAETIKKHIKQPDNYHKAFRCSNISGRIQLKEYEKLLSRNEKRSDIFAKHLNYLRINNARAAGLYNYCPVFESAQEPIIRNNGRDIIMLGTNAYLGLSTHPRVKEAAQKAIEKYGTGCSGSPMLNGTLDLHKQLSYELALFFGKQDVLIFSTGYQTNVGVVSALANRNDIIIIDERNHASIVDGAILSRGTIVRYKHNNMESLEAVLKANADKPKLVVTDSLFSMEGTVINLPEVVRLVKQYHARLMLDESHAIGVMGKTGRGVAELYGLSNDVDIIMGTFSKSLASIGGFVAGNDKIIDTLKHTSRAHIFSASLPPSAVAAVLASLKIIEEEPQRRDQLLKNAAYFANGLNRLGFKTNYQSNPVISIHCGHELLTVAAYQCLFEKGVFVNPVTSPAVPRNHEILRISLMATHTEAMLNKALNVFEQIKTPYWPTK